MEWCDIVSLTRGGLAKRGGSGKASLRVTDYLRKTMSNCHIWEEQGERSLQITRAIGAKALGWGPLGSQAGCLGWDWRRVELTATEESGEITWSQSLRTL